MPNETAPDASPPAAPAPPPERAGWPRVVVVAALVAVAAVVGLRLDRGAAANERGVSDAAGVPGGAGEAPGEDLALGRAVAELEVRGVDGRSVPAAPAGEPAVIMVSSVTCGYCKAALSDIADMADGRPVPRLRVVTLEGAREGAAMLERHGVVGAFAAGPAGSAEQVLLTFRIPGTPVFAAVDSAGRVTRVVPGYPGREGLAALYRVMAGERPATGSPVAGS
ncbi:MAG: TlpA family protein disulfide reductase [Gemmatimonadaceae bacterium]